MDIVGTSLSAAQTLHATLQCPQFKDMPEFIGYESQLDDLKRAIEAVIAELRDAERKQDALPEQTQLLCKNLTEVVFEANDLLDEFVTLAEQKLILKVEGRLYEKVRGFFSRSNRFSAAMQIRKGVKNIRKNLDAIVYNNQFNFVHDPEPSRKLDRETYSYVNEVDIVGRDDDLDHIVNEVDIVGRDDDLDHIVGSGIVIPRNEKATIEGGESSTEVKEDDNVVIKVDAEKVVVVVNRNGKDEVDNDGGFQPSQVNSNAVGSSADGTDEPPRGFVARFPLFNRIMDRVNSLRPSRVSDRTMDRRMTIFQITSTFALSLITCIILVSTTPRDRLSDIVKLLVVGALFMLMVFLWLICVFCRYW